ncbi:MAG: type I pullulanase [Bacteroidetes bacterium]|nr:MAG: type I pullulanase [Bacteroidota bacterium]
MALCFSLFLACQNDFPTRFDSFDDYPVYDGDDLGLSFSPEKATFKIWAPTAQNVKIRLYEKDLGGEPLAEKNLTRGADGVWEVVFNENIEGRFYTFEAQVNGQWLGETTDPYVKAAGRNGRRGQVVDFAKTNPEGWAADRSPTLENPTDAIIYELHIRDLSSHENSGIEHKGKFLALTETGRKSPAGVATGLDHLREMGITHVHLLPVFDFKSVDETRLDEPQFNWGYDPQNYNVPEGSYSTNPADGATRIREFKQMVQALHQAGIGVIMDVVYNHTFDTQSPFEMLVPGYFYRQDSTGQFSNASGCGNETASERPMMRKFMTESLRHWVETYHVDGFRFDLMGIHDIETMNHIARTLRALKPDILLYGEGWTAGSSPLPDSLRALKHNVPKLEGIAAFSDDLRDAAKGHVFTRDAKAFVSGLPGLEESIKFGIAGASPHPQVDYQKVNYSKAPWAPNPTQCINYVSCHDNHTLWDRLLNSCPEATPEARIEMDKLANTIVLTAQGIPFLHAGVEMLRTKKGVENSFESPDSINQIDWDWKARHAAVVEYYKALIRLRKAHPAFRMTSAEQLRAHLQFLDFQRDNLVGFELVGHPNGDDREAFLVVFNGNTTPQKVTVLRQNWTIIAHNGTLNPDGLGAFPGGPIVLSPHTALILAR